MVDVAGGVAGDVFRAILALILLGAGLGGFVPVILGALASSTVGGAFKQLLKRLAGKVGEPGSEVVKCFMEFINTAREASRYIDYKEVQGIVSDVAREWGMGTNAFKNLVRGFASLTEGRLVTEDEVRRLFENGLKKVEELEAKVDELNNWINILKQELTANIIIAGKVDFEQGTIYPNIKVESGELRVRVGDGYHSIVRAGKFNELISDVESKLMGNGVVVVVGPKGIGKSTLATATVWELLMNSDIGLVARVDVLDSKNYPKFVTFVENYGEEFGKYFGRLLILYDPVSTKAYERVGVDVEAPIQTNIERTVKNLMDVVNSVSPEASRPFMLIVLPSDVYNALSEEIRDSLERYRLDVSLSDAEFLTELIREYTKTKSNPNGCELSNDVLSKLTSELVKFDSGHALIARLIGEELARSNCDVSKVEELISKAKGKAEKFIILHINGLFKVHENPNTAKVLVEVFALRRPFVDSARPGDPILTPGIIELISEKREASLLQSAEGGELRGWLARRQHDLIEETIKKLLICIVNDDEECKEKLGTTLEPWRLRTVRKSLREVSEKVLDVSTAVEYFVDNYGKKLTRASKVFSNECWKRAALIIGFALAGHVSVPRPEDLRKDVAESLGDVLRECGVDDYLLVDGVIPPLIMNLIKNHTRALVKVFIDKYNEAVAEVNRILNIARGRGGISPVEGFYGLGLASIIAKAVESGKPVGPSDADAALHIASFAIQDVVSPIFIMPILRALEPLRGKAPHRCIELLASASYVENLDLVAVEYILNELNEVLGSYGYEVEGYAWSLVYAIRAYANLLGKHRSYFNREEVGDVVGRVVGLLNELGRFKSSLGVIAWAYALAPALRHEKVRRLMEETLGINVVNKASEVLGGLNKLRERVQELISDEEFMGYVESMSVKADEETVRKVILGASSLLKHALAIYRFGNDELNEAEELFNAAAEESREIGDYENDLVARGWALRVEAIKGSLVGDELVRLVDGFRQLYEEAFNKERFSMPTAMYLSIASDILGDYLVSLALTGDDKKINELLEEHWQVLDTNEQVSVLTRLMLNALLGSRVGLSGELEGRLIVEPRELIDTFGSDMHIESLPALMVALGTAEPEDAGSMCMSINDSIKRRTCMYAISVAMNDNAAVVLLRGWLIDAFRELLLEKLGLLKELGADADAMLNEFMELVYGLDGKSLVQLIAPKGSMAQLVLMLRALINGDEELAKAQKLAKAHALMGAIYATEKLPARLFLEAYRACCDLGSEEFRRAIVSLFFYYV
jgi:energy-coupling factor transporter ATP-binding protein EcfA2